MVAEGEASSSQTTLGSLRRRACTGAVLLDGLPRGRGAQRENVDGDAVVARVDLGGENLDALRGERPGDVGEEPVAVARADRQKGARPVEPPPLPPERVVAESTNQAE